MSSSERAQFKQNMNHLQTLVDSARTAGIPVVIIYNPDRNHVGLDRVPPPPSYEQFRTYIDQQDIPILDLQELWRDQEAVRHFYRDHVHLNEEGNAVLAERLNQFVQSENLPVCRP
jgi:lysophospholipase L1-like esterase